MRLISAIFFIFLAACTTTRPATGSVETPDGTLVDAEAYNAIVASQGLAHYCGRGKCDSLPQLVKGYAPVYPTQLQSKGTTGHATIVFIIDVSGRVVEPRVESATAPEFSGAAIAALSSWVFRPATLRGKPVEMISRQIFPFELR